VIAGFDAENLLAAIYEIVRWAKAEAGESKTSTPAL
jgi:hydrogenase maturation factor